MSFDIASHKGILLDTNLLLLLTKKLFTTPNILTEASNLLAHDLMPVLGTLIGEFEECYVKSSQIVEENTKLFEKFGLSDAIIK